MSWLSKFLHPERGYEKAQDELNRYFQQTQNYYNQAQGLQQPYNLQGQQAYGPLSGAMNRLLDPTQLQAQWASSYAESPEAKLAEEMAQTRGLDAASSMGLLGSNTALQGIQAGKSGIALEDRRNYMNDLMQKYLAGAGLAQNIYGTGAQTAGQMGQNAMNMGQNAMNMGQNSANMAYGRENAQGDLFGKLAGAGLGLAGSYLGSGGFSPRGYNPWNRSGQYSGGY